MFIPFHDVIDHTCKELGVRKETLLGRGHPAKVVRLRHTLMFVGFCEMKRASTLIARLMRRHHSVVLYGADRTRERMAQGDEITLKAYKAATSYLAMRKAQDENHTSQLESADFLHGG